MSWWRKGVIVGGLAGILLSGCEENEIEPPVQEPEKPKIEQESKVEPIYDNVKKISSDQLKNIESVETNAVYFSNPTEFKKGQIIIGGISEKTPGGILKKISNVSSDKKKISTTSASLEEVIQEGRFVIDKKLESEDLENKSGLKETTGYEFHYPIEKTVIFDLDKNPNTTNDQVTLSGDVYFDLSYRIDAKFEKGTKFLSFSTSIRQDAEFVLEGNLDKQINEEVQLYKKSFVPFVIPTPYAIPLILRPKLEINAGAIGEINGKAVAKINESFSSASTVAYINGKWETDSGLSKHLDAQFVEGDANAKIKGYVLPRLDLVINEIAGPFAVAEGYLEINVDTNKNPWWELYGGANVSMGIDMGLFSKIIPDYEKELINHKELICQAEGGLFDSNSPPEAMFQITPQEGDQETVFSFDASSTIDDYDSLENLFYRWDFEGDGTWETNWSKGKTLENHSYSAAGTYAPTLEVKDSHGATDMLSKQITVDEIEELLYSEFIDPIDGKRYDIIKINGKWWFGENYERYLPTAYYPENDSINNHTYGRLYTWEDAERVCPDGWRIPTISEWYNMMNSIDNTGSFSDNIMGQQIGNILKEKGTAHWKEGNQGRDEIGFGVRGAGYNWANGNGQFLKKRADLWSSTSHGPDDKWGVIFDYDEAHAIKFPFFRTNSHSLRFVKND